MTFEKRLYRMRREDELGALTNEKLEQICKAWKVHVEQLVGGRRYSMIIAIIDWEKEHKLKVDLQ